MFNDQTFFVSIWIEVFIKQDGVKSTMMYFLRYLARTYSMHHRIMDLPYDSYDKMGNNIIYTNDVGVFTSGT